MKQVANVFEIFNVGWASESVAHHSCRQGSRVINLPKV